jgi:putative membrane protein insertion efficiency factor
MRIKIMANEIKARLTRMVQVTFVTAIKAYRLVLSPWLGGRCRFVPSCSSYALEAIDTHGPFRGAWLALRRLARCRPGGGWGYDPVPESGKSARWTRRRRPYEL